MNQVDANSLFRGVKYNQVTRAELLPKLSKKVEQLKAKIEERKERLEEIRGRFKINREGMLELIAKYLRDQQHGRSVATYSLSNSAVPSAPEMKDVSEVAVPAGVIANIVTENELIENEQELVKKISLVAHRLNVQPQLFKVHPQTGATIAVDPIYELSDHELEFFGLV